MSTQLAVRQLSPDKFSMIMQMAPIMHTARLFGTLSTEQAAAIMFKGFELGFSVTASFENIHVIKDKPSLSPKGALAMIYSSPEFGGITINDEVDKSGVPIACTVWMKRKSGFEYTTRFSMDDAKRADLVKSDSGWAKYPGNMLRWRAIGYAADVVFPDVIGGTKRADEFGADLTPDGDVIEGSWTQAAPQAIENLKVGLPPFVQTVSQSRPLPVGDRLTRLVDEYGAGAIMEANNNVIPGTDEELDAVEAYLQRELEITGGK